MGFFETILGFGGRGGRGSGTPFHRLPLEKKSPTTKDPRVEVVAGARSPPDCHGPLAPAAGLEGLSADQGALFASPRTSPAPPATSGQTSP